MNLYATASLVASVSCITLGLYVYLKDTRRAINTAFALIACLAGIWTAFPFLTSLPPDGDVALLVGRIIYVFAAFVPPAFFYFVLVLLGIESVKAERRRLILLFLISLVFAVQAFHPDFIQGIFRKQPFSIVTPGLLYIPFMMFFGAASTYTFYRYICGYLHTAGSKRNQLKYILVAFLIAHVAALMHFLAAYLRTEPIPHDFLLILFAGIITHAIVKHRVMDIAVVMKAGLVHALNIGMVLVPAALIFVLIKMQMDVHLSRLETVAIFALFALIATASYTIKTSTKDAVARAMFRSRYNMYDTLSEFSRALVTILDLKTLTEEIIHTLANVIGINTASLYLLDKRKDTYVLSSSYGCDSATANSPRFKTMDALPLHLARSQKVLVREELEHSTEPSSTRSILPALKAMDTEVCIPLVNKNRLIGFCNLGTRTDYSMYSDDDLQLLTTLGQNAAIALDNASLYEELKRSQTFMRRIDRLRSMETIAAGFAHEIRNPLTSIKTYMQLAPLRKDDHEFNGYFHKVASDDVARIERLIEEILGYARSKEPHFQPEDLNDIVASSLYFVELKAYHNAMIVEKALTHDLPPVILDRQQITQVLLNLFLNALDAMHALGGRLTVQTHRLPKPDHDAWIQIEVADTGAGIAPENLEHIFDPFYSTKHESKDREGTGLGLTIVHQIVQDHGGYIEVTSTQGRGTTFFVNLPVNPLRPTLHDAS